MLTYHEQIFGDTNRMKLFLNKFGPLLLFAFPIILIIAHDKIYRPLRYADVNRIECSILANEALKMFRVRKFEPSRSRLEEYKNQERFFCSPERIFNLVETAAGYPARYDLEKYYAVEIGGCTDLGSREGYTCTTSDVDGSIYE